MSNPEEFTVSIGMDAFRLSLGLPRRQYTDKQIMRWLRLMSGLAKGKSDD